jgi:hypothetical protein
MQYTYDVRENSDKIMEIKRFKQLSIVSHICFAYFFIFVKYDKKKFAYISM